MSCGSTELNLVLLEPEAPFVRIAFTSSKSPELSWVVSDILSTASITASFIAIGTCKVGPRKGDVCTRYRNGKKYQILDDVPAVDMETVS